MTEHAQRQVAELRTSLMSDLHKLMEHSDPQTVLLTLEMIALSLAAALDRIEEADRS